MIKAYSVGRGGRLAGYVALAVLSCAELLIFIANIRAGRGWLFALPPLVLWAILAALVVRMMQPVAVVEDGIVHLRRTVLPSLHWKTDDIEVRSDPSDVTACLLVHKPTGKTVRLPVAVASAEESGHLEAVVAVLKRN